MRELGEEVARIHFEGIADFANNSLSGTIFSARLRIGRSASPKMLVLMQFWPE